MNTTSLRARSLACALLATTAYCGFTAAPAQAQEASVVAFPVRQFTDDNGVDLLSGAFTAYTPSVSIGSADMGLTYARQVRAGLYRDTMMGTVSISGSTYTVGIGGASEAFTASGNLFTPVEQNGSTLTLSGGTYTYRRADGTTATFTALTHNFGNAAGIVITSLAYPSGRMLAFHYIEDTYTAPRTGTVTTGRRLQSVTTNAGYQLKLSYVSDTPGGPTGGNWSKVANVKGLNSSVDACDVFAFSCPQTGRPELSIAALAGGIESYADSEGRATKYTLSGNVVTAIRFPGSAGDDVTIAYTSGKVSSVTAAGVTTSYAFADASGVRTTTVTRGGASRIMTFDIAKSLLLSGQDELGRTTSYQYDGSNRPTRITRPEGNYTAFTYDARGNATETRSVAKAGSGLADIVATASFDASCTVAVKCNKPNSATDARGNTTGFTYDTTHGGLLTATAPAVGGVSPQTRISYARLDSFGTVSASGIFVPTATSACQTQASCAGAADEVKAAVTYGQGMLPSSVSAGSGNGALTATNSMTYDVAGNLLTVDGPLSGTADTTRFRYNANRELVGTVSPDPDGAGSLKHRAQRVTIAATGLVDKVEQGNVNSQSDSDWAGFSPLEAAETGYDAYRRPVTSKLVAGGTTHALSQTSYDALGRPECSAQRMNSAEFGSLPADACTLDTPGAFGPDRIVKTIYNAADEVTQVKSAVGTSDEANEVTATYRPNGQSETVTDAENNKTTYIYDGHDRLSQTQFPSTTKGAGTSNSADYEQLGYDAGSNVASFRNRAGETISFTFDALGRRTLKDRPGTELDDSYTYDLLGRLTSANNNNGLTLAYDALGRQLSQTGPHGTIASQWDIAGRRTRLTHPDGFYITYDHLVTGEMSHIRENGATSGVGVLAVFGYDDMGRRTSLTRGNGAVTSYAYDAASRLSQLAQDVAGTAHDQVLGFAYNPASQIVSNTRSNDLYAWTGHGSGTTNAAVNGLNQLTTHGGAGVTHDARGNLTSDGTRGFAYDSENRLMQGPSTSYGYDPLGRLNYSHSDNDGFDYDGTDLIVHRSGTSGPVRRRYVHGPGTDEPLVWYEGSGTADRRFLHADERGSIVAVSDGAGNATGTMTYDEYGRMAGTGTISWFQYTGQLVIWDGLYYYKARVYDPKLGRFLQSDPIGYGDGMNVYAYVKGDPVNFTDPTGTTVLAPKGPNDEEILVTGQRCGPGRICISGPMVGPGYDGDGQHLVVTFRRGGRGKLTLQSAMEFSLVKNSVGCAAARETWILASKASGTALDTATEEQMMGRYFGGGGGSYRLSPSEWRGVQSYYNTYGDEIVSGGRTSISGGRYTQSVNFAGTYADKRFDGLLGTATGTFDANENLLSIYDVFDFDSGARGPGALGYAAGQAVGLVEKDANYFCPKGANPVSISGGD